MDGQRINRVGGRVILVLSLTALATVHLGSTQPQTDEGALAHIFQLAIVALAPMILLFLGRADWKQPFRSARRPALPAVTLGVAFGALYDLEHIREIFCRTTLHNKVLSKEGRCTPTAISKRT
jgi:hypothetical protein